MTRRGGNILSLVVLAVASVSGAMASAQSLDADAKAEIATFGNGVVVPIAGDGKVERAEEFLGFQPGTKQYKVISGKDQGSLVGRTVRAKTGSKDTYTVALGKFFTATLKVEKDGVFLTTEVEPSTSSLSTFNPNEIVLLNGLSKGQKKDRTISVQVHDIDQPTVVTHTGSLNCTYEVLGAFKVTSPAGVFDTVGIRVKYKGTVGPASVEDANYLFFAKGVGPVAMRFRSHISAFLVYNKSDKQSLLLAKK